MHKILRRCLIACTLLFIAVNAMAQTQLTYSPALPKLIDDITITIDLNKCYDTRSKSMLALTEGVYLWTGANTSFNGSYNYQPPGQSNFNKPNEATRMTFLGDGKWRISFNIKQFYRVPDGAAVKQLILIAKNGTGNAQTETFYIPLGITPYKTLPLPAGMKDGVNYLDDRTVLLSLLAPRKKFVHLIGDETNWQLNPNYILNRTPDGERYWIKIGGLTPGKEYRFQYLIDGYIRTADPYSDKVLDPNFDKSIPAETYPNLITYPYGKTTHPVSVVQTAQKPYNWQVKTFATPPKNKMVIYELCIRDFSAKHNYKTVMDSLNYLQKLGVNVIELMPVTDFEGNLGWGYNPNHYFAPDKYFGTKDELKALVDECHKRGIAVILDMVFNHSWGYNPQAIMYWNYSTFSPAADNPWYNAVDSFAFAGARYGPDINHESPYTKRFIDSVNAYWINEYKIDGYRFDFTKGMTNDPKPLSDPWGDKYDASRIAILKRMTTAMWKVKPDAIAIFEHLCFDNKEEKELADHGIMLWSNFTYHFTKLTKGEAVDISWMNYKQRNWQQSNVVAYWCSHDWQRPIVDALANGRSNDNYNTRLLPTALERMKLNAAFLYPIPGPRMIWMFDELGYDVDKDLGGYGEAKPIRWEYLKDTSRLKLYKAMAAIIKLKQNYLADAERATFTVDGITKSMQLTSGDLNTTIIGNFDIVTKMVNPKFQHTGLWYDYFTGLPVEVQNATTPYTLAAGEFHIFVDKKISFPEKGLVPFTVKAANISIEPDPQKLGISVYPNPATGIFNVKAGAGLPSSGTIRVYTYAGRSVSSVVSRVAERHYQVNITGQPAGLYILNLQSGNQSVNVRVVKQ